MLLAGDGPSRPGLEKLARETGVQRYVIFAASSNTSKPSTRHSIFFFSIFSPSRSALPCSPPCHDGFPVVGVASGGVPEIVTSEKNGLLVPKPGAEAFATSVKRLIRNPEEARAFAAAARETISEKFTDDRMVESTIAKYQQLLGHS